jgi:LPXTG-site transpeptidase (sortase) family protein
MLLILTIVQGLPQRAVFAVSANFRLIIPDIHIDLPVGEAHYYGNTWYIPWTTTQIEHLEGRWLPGDKQNVALAAHVDLGPGRPGPFFKLHQLQPGDAIYIEYGSVWYIYQVDRAWIVLPTDISPLMSTDREALTLITCAGDRIGYSYTERLIVRALLVAIDPVRPLGFRPGGRIMPLPL